MSKDEYEEEYPLYTIFEGMTRGTMKHKIAENVCYVLKREGIVKKGRCNVIIPEGGYDFSCDAVDEKLRMSKCVFDGNFEVFNGHDKIVGYGGVVADCWNYEEREPPLGNTLELLSIQVFLKPSEIKKIKKELK